MRLIGESLGKSLKKGFVFTFIAGVFCATHLWGLGRAPGFHFDEAWAANHALRIFSEPGFWPLQAQSAYTASWGHYLAALSFKLFGVSLEAYRFSGVLWVVSGLALLSGALRRAGNPSAVPWLWLLVALSPTAVANHRFVIEISSFHVFCFGLVAWSLSLAQVCLRSVGVFLGVLLGVSSHLMFLAPALALLVMGASSRELFLRPWIRRTVLSLALVLGPLFLSLSFRIPEKDKALGLAAGALVLVLVLSLCELKSFRKRVETFFERKVPPFAQKWGSGIVLLLFLPFWDGHWSFATQVGGLEFPATVGLTSLWVVLLFWAKPGDLSASQQKLERFVSVFAILLLMTVWGVMVKPTPRYFELPLLSVLVWVAVSASQLPKWGQVRFSALWVLVGGLSFWANYAEPLFLAHIPRYQDHSLHFGPLLKDSSEDFTLKQPVFDFLLTNGCKEDQIHTGDPRIAEALRFWVRVSDPVRPTAAILLNPELTCFSSGERGIGIERANSPMGLGIKMDWIIWQNFGLLVHRK